MKMSTSKKSMGATVPNSDLKKRDGKTKRAGRGANKTGKVNKL